MDVCPYHTHPCLTWYLCEVCGVSHHHAKPSPKEDMVA